MKEHVLISVPIERDLWACASLLLTVIYIENLIWAGIMLEFQCKQQQIFIEHHFL